MDNYDQEPKTHLLRFTCSSAATFKHPIYLVPKGKSEDLRAADITKISLWWLPCSAVLIVLHLLSRFFHSRKPYSWDDRLYFYSNCNSFSIRVSLGQGQLVFFQWWEQETQEPYKTLYWCHNPTNSLIIISSSKSQSLEQKQIVDLTESSYLLEIRRNSAYFSSKKGLQEEL